MSEAPFMNELYAELSRFVGCSLRKQCRATQESFDVCFRIPKRLMAGGALFFCGKFLVASAGNF
jgi:hypothetical protein